MRTAPLWLEHFAWPFVVRKIKPVSRWFSWVEWKPRWCKMRPWEEEMLTQNDLGSVVVIAFKFMNLDVWFIFRMGRTIWYLFGFVLRDGQKRDTTMTSTLCKPIQSNPDRWAVEALVHQFVVMDHRCRYGSEDIEVPYMVSVFMGFSYPPCHNLYYDYCLLLTLHPFISRIASRRRSRLVIGCIINQRLNFN